MSAYILLVEGEPDMAALVAYHLARESYRVHTVSDGAEALEAVERERPDLVVLDLSPRRGPGAAVLRELRSRPELTDIPVVLLTAGADEPFSPHELILRVGTVLRRVRQQPVAESGYLRVGPVTMDTGAAIARVNGQRLELTATEYRLLQVMVDRRGRVQSRRQLLEAVWHTTADINTRTVDMHIQRLRRKLGPAAGWVETVRGSGYRFRAEPPEP